MKTSHTNTLITILNSSLTHVCSEYQRNVVTVSNTVMTNMIESRKRYERTLLHLELVSRITEVTLHTLKTHSHVVMGVAERMPLVINMINALGDVLYSANQLWSLPINGASKEKQQAVTRLLVGVSIMTVSILGFVFPPLALTMAAAGTGMDLMKTMASAVDCHIQTGKVKKPDSQDDEQVEELAQLQCKLKTKKEKIVMGGLVLASMVTMVLCPASAPVVSALIAVITAFELYGNKKRVSSVKNAAVGFFKAAANSSSMASCQSFRLMH
jgi:hypothetical protein